MRALPVEQRSFEAWTSGADLVPSLSLSCSQRFPAMFSTSVWVPLRHGRKLSRPFLCLATVTTSTGGSWLLATCVGARYVSTKQQATAEEVCTLRRALSIDPSTGVEACAELVLQPHLPHFLQGDGCHCDHLMCLIADLHQHLLRHLLHAHLKLSPIDGVPKAVHGRVRGVPPCMPCTGALGALLPCCRTHGQHGNHLPYLRGGTAFGRGSVTPVVQVPVISVTACLPLGMSSTSAVAHPAMKTASVARTAAPRSSPLSIGSGSLPVTAS